MTRKFVNKHLCNGVSPSDITFALSFVAADLGLEVAPTQITAVNVFISGLNTAIRNALNAEDKSETEIEWAQDESNEYKFLTVIH